jgi:hypothetical protein
VTFLFLLSPESWVLAIGLVLTVMKWTALIVAAVGIGARRLPRHYPAPFDYRSHLRVRDRTRRGPEHSSTWRFR